MEIIVELPNGDKKSIKYLNKDDKVSKLRNEIKNQFDIDFQNHGLYFYLYTLNETMDDTKLGDIGFENDSIVLVRQISKNLGFFYIIIFNI